MVVVLSLKIKLNKMNNQLKNYNHQSLKNFRKRKVYSLFKDNVQGADLADIQLLSKFNKRIPFLLCLIDIFSKYACVVPLNYKKGATIVNAFQSILND